MHKRTFAIPFASLFLLVSFLTIIPTAQAQECFAFQSSPTKVRAEGITENVGGIQLQCRHKTGFGVADLPTNVTLSIRLNTQITNKTNDDGQVEGLKYGGELGEGKPGVYAGEDKEVLSSDGEAIEWTIASADFKFPSDEKGASITITGIMANASAVGDGEDVTAAVTVNGVVIEHSPIKLADVTTGLDITVTAAKGLQCQKTTEIATIKFVEGFPSAIGAAEGEEQELVLNLRDIPEGVTVTPSMKGTAKVALASDGKPDPDEEKKLAPLTLKTESTSGVNKDGEVELSATGSGKIVYTFDTKGTSDKEAKEWNEVTLTFTWDSGEPGVGSGSVTVSYHPVGGDKIPRYAAGPNNPVLTSEECLTSLLFPFVTNMYGFETGIALTNTSDADGPCTISYSGTDAPADDQEMMVMAGSTATFGVSTIAPGFQGFIEAMCGFQNAQGFAFISNGFGSMGGPTAAQGYIAVEEKDNFE